MPRFQLRWIACIPPRKKNDLAEFGELALLSSCDGWTAAKMRCDRSSSTGRGAMRRLEAKGTTIAYARTGAGPPIVLMHGAEADHSMSARLSAQLDSHRTVIVCDQRGSGDGASPGQPSTFEDL